MIQVEALEPIKSHGYILAAGDRLTIDDGVAKIWCGAGWAKAVNGEIETGQRKVTRAVVMPHSATHVQKAEEVRNG